MIYGNATGGFGMPKTIVLEDVNGNSFTGVVVDNEVVFTATDNDVREGKTYASDNGASVGTKDIPSYRTYKASDLVMPGCSYSIKLDKYVQYDYTQFQGIISKFNTSIDDSVFTDKISINDHVYAVNSSDAISDIVKNAETESIDLNIINDTDDIYIIHYFTYREET